MRSNGRERRSLTSLKKTLFLQYRAPRSLVPQHSGRRGGTQTRSKRGEGEEKRGQREARKKGQKRGDTESIAEKVRKKKRPYAGRPTTSLFIL